MTLPLVVEGRGFNPAGKRAYYLVSWLLPRARRGETRRAGQKRQGYGQRLLRHG